MPIVKQAIVLNQNILASANSVIASLSSEENVLDFQVEVVINSEDEKSNYTEEEQQTMRLIEADTDLASPDISIYLGAIKVISKKLDPKNTLFKLSFQGGPSKVPNTPGL